MNIQLTMNLPSQLTLTVVLHLRLSGKSWQPSMYKRAPVTGDTVGHVSKQSPLSKNFVPLHIRHFRGLVILRNRQFSANRCVVDVNVDVSEVEVEVAVEVEVEVEVRDVVVIVIDVVVVPEVAVEVLSNVSEPEPLS